MGVVYRARDTRLDREAAIKVLRGDAVADLRRQKRFIQEAKAASGLNHPKIVTIHDISTADGVLFMAMGLALPEISMKSNSTALQSGDLRATIRSCEFRLETTTSEQ